MTRLKLEKSLILGIMWLIWVSWAGPSMAQTFYIPEPIYTPQFEITSAQLRSFQPPRGQSIGSHTGFRKIRYQEALVLSIGLSQADSHALPNNAVPHLSIGPFEYGIRDSGMGRGIIWDFHITNQEEIPEGTPVILTAWPADPMEAPDASDINPPKFSHDMIVDKRWTVFGGFVDEFASFNLRSRASVPNAIVKVNGGDISLSMVTYDTGWFNLNYPDGITLEEGESYTVEVLINDVVLLSKTITREMADYPEWSLKLEPQDSTFYEIKGHVYDVAGDPIPEVTLTLDEHHSVITDDNGYFRLIGLFAGTYTLMASKEGYNFKPVEITGGQGQPVTIDLVESSPTQCLLYAVHNKSKKKDQLFSADLSKEDFEVKPLGFKHPKHDISLAAADFDGDGVDEIAMAAKKGGHTVTLYELDGTVIRSFPVVKANGVSLASGDVDGDDKPEIIVASRSANQKSVLVYTNDGTALEPVAMFDKNTRMSPTVGDVDGDKKADIIAGRLLKEDQVAVYNSASQEMKRFSVFQSRSRKNADKAGKATGKARSLTYGVNVASDDFNDDGKVDIVAAQASKGSQVEIYNSSGILINTLTAFDSNDGVVVTAGNVIDDDQPEIIVGEAKGTRIRGFNVAGEQVFEFEAVKKGTVSSLTVFRCEEN